MNSIAKRLALSALSSLVAVTAIGCGSSTLSSIQVLPGTGTQVLNGTGQTAQFRAIGSYTRANHATTTRDVTDMASWASSQGAVASISSSGLATAGTTYGTTVVTASLSGSTGLVAATSDVTVTGTATAGSGVLTSIAIIPGSQEVGTPSETGQFIAIGTFANSSIPTQDLTQLVAWQSSDIKIASVDNSGLATALSSAGTTTLTAIGKASSGAVVTGSATFTVSSATVSQGLATLTVYKVGNGKESGVVTGKNINCGPPNPGSGCTGNYTLLDATVTLTAKPTPPSSFGGWSANCHVTAATPTVPANPLVCTIILTNNDTVGAIFN